MFKLTAVILALLASALAFAQRTPKEALLQTWNDGARKVAAVAAEFPEDKYDYRPTKEVRTFAQQLLHIAFWNQFLAQKMSGKNPDPKPNELPRASYKTRAAVTDVVRKSFEEAAAVLKSMPDAKVLENLGYWDGFTEHNGEHYGQLVIYYRLNGLVPPESRPKK